MHGMHKSDSLDYSVIAAWPGYGENGYDGSRFFFPHRISFISFISLGSQVSPSHLSINGSTWRDSSSRRSSKVKMSFKPKTVECRAWSSAPRSALSSGQQFWLRVWGGTQLPGTGSVTHAVRQLNHGCNGKCSPISVVSDGINVALPQPRTRE